jgi:phenylpyruvate tautomerase PptA (4-oxalocrotonate tautomerase family)
MPLVRVSLRQGQSLSYIAAIGEGIHQAMIETINVPADDRFQIITEHSAGGLAYDPGYLGIARTDRVLLIQITLNSGRTLDQKRALYRTIAEKLQTSPGIRKEDVLINLTEVSKENWSFGNGIASYAP